MKADIQAKPSFYMSLILKIAGLLLILGVFIDYVMVSIPPNFLNSEWLSNWINEWVGRGTIPLIGIALILFGVWIEQSNRVESRSKDVIRGWLAWSLILSGLLGIIFLVLAPIYFRSNQLASAAATRQINEEAAAAESQLNTELEQRRSQVSAILANEALVDQLQSQLQSASSLSETEQTFLQGIQETLQQVQDDPNALDQKVEEARQQGLEQIQQQQQQAIDKITTEQRKSRFRITLNSVLLAIGYFFIAWNGLGFTDGTKPPKAKPKKTPRRNKK